MDKVLRLIEGLGEVSSKQFQALLEIASDNRATIRSLTQLLQNTPGIDETKLNDIIADMDAFEDELSKRAESGT